MAHIKCRYVIPYCEYDFQHVRLHHDQYWFCDCNNDACIGIYKKPSKEADNAINPKCVHCFNYSGEFEKTFKQYEYTVEGDLYIGSKQFDQSEIIYLEVDGRVLVDEE